MKLYDPSYTPQAGDLYACWGTAAVSRLISAWTSIKSFALGPLRWSPSHVAIAIPHPELRFPAADEAELGDYLWAESTTLSGRECQVAGVPANGVQAHWIDERLADYEQEGGRVEVYRLTPIDKLDDYEAFALRQILLKHFIGRRIGYDYGGAVISGIQHCRLLRHVVNLLGGDLESVFCSELCAALLQRLGRMNRANPTRFDPGALLRRLLKDGTYTRLGRIETVQGRVQLV